MNQGRKSKALTNFRVVVSGAHIVSSLGRNILIIDVTGKQPNITITAVDTHKDHVLLTTTALVQSVPVSALAKRQQPHTEGTVYWDAALFNQLASHVVNTWLNLYCIVQDIDD
jgi:D-alanine-D-alanine ligase-like ATP-grasp enzyme